MIRNENCCLYTPPPGIRLLTLDCRAHGATQPLGDERSLSFAAFADDLVALLDYLEIAQAVVDRIYSFCMYPNDILKSPLRTLPLCGTKLLSHRAQSHRS